MKLTGLMTLLGTAVLMLASINTALAADTPVTSFVKTKETKKSIPEAEFHIALSVTRSTNLIDFQDGSRSDGLDYDLAPVLKMPMGAVALRLSYSQDLRDENSHVSNDFGDIPVTFSFPKTALTWFESKNTQLGYSLTALIPISRYSTQKDELKTSLSGAISLSTLPPEDDGFSFRGSLSLGQNLHTYEEDINGSILNKYSSNQSIGIAYDLSSWTFDLSFTNRTRLTYKNNVKSSFEVTQEISYGFNEKLSAAIGHSNSGGGLKANGEDSNIDLINENSSVVYASLNWSH